MINKMNTRVSLIFPYIGDDDQVREKLIQIIEAILNEEKHIHTSSMKPILVVNKDTVFRGKYKRFKDYLESKHKEDLLTKLEIEEVWAVDTCQMWLAGFGKIIDDNTNNPEDDTSSVLQIPGDLKDVRDFDVFLEQLRGLRAGIEAGDWDFAIGDFEVEPEKSKHLIDMYGTYPLLFNWFPNIAKKLREDKKIKRPRSEFLVASLEFLKVILPFKRKFAYEQTLTFLIHALSDTEKTWKIGKVDIGVISDYEKSRGFREANDQIERTERLLKFLWREMNSGDEFDVNEFERLDRRSTAIREAAIVSLGNFLREYK